MNSFKKYDVWEVVLRIKLEDEDVISGKLFEAGSSGIWSEGEGEFVTLHAYFNSPISQSRIKEITGTAPLRAGPFTVELKEEPSDPVIVEDAIISSEEQHFPVSEKVNVILKSSMAFGTGRHASTRLAIKALRELSAGNNLQGTLLDIGTGTGILAIYAVKKGAKFALAVDNDPLACEVAEVNVKANRLEDFIKVVCAEPQSVKGFFDVVVANITSEVHLKLFTEYLRLCHGYLILSGIYENPSPVKALFERYNFNIVKVYNEDEWWSITGKAGTGSLER